MTSFYPAPRSAWVEHLGQEDDVADPNQVKKLVGEIWGEILAKVRGSPLSVADKIRAMDFISIEATKLADSVRHGDHDGKIADQAKLAAESVSGATAEMSALVVLIRDSKLHKSQAPGLPDLSTFESTLEGLRGQMKKALAFYEGHAPSIVDRVGAIQISDRAEPEEVEDLPF
jgi:hypothetical protein